MRMGLIALFAKINGKNEEVASPNIENGDANYAGTDGEQGELFADTKEPLFSGFNKADVDAIAALYSDLPSDFSNIPPCISHFRELSPNACDQIALAWMSELPVIVEAIRFGQAIIEAANTAQSQMEQRRAVERVATDLGNSDVQVVQNAAHKAWREFERLRGLLRFCPDEDGTYVAFCEPDHFVLPAFGPHFTKRFGETPWAIADNKRRLCLCRKKGQKPTLFAMHENPAFLADKPSNGTWEHLWQQYHKTINNESRNNPDLQRRFMPKRYWKYLTELQR